MVPAAGGVVMDSRNTGARLTLIVGPAIVALASAVAFSSDEINSRPEPNGGENRRLDSEAEPLPPISVRFLAADNRETPSFRRHVIPLLGRLGCNGRACHGSFQGRGGFRLSLFGYDFKMDHEALTRGAEPRVNLHDPDASLIVQKPTLRTPHEGGLRYNVGSWQHRLLLRWIEGGAVGIKSTDPEFVRLDVSEDRERTVAPAESAGDAHSVTAGTASRAEPWEIRFAKKGERVAIRVVAHWFARWSHQAISEDVTPLCRFRSNDEQIATVDA